MSANATPNFMIAGIGNLFDFFHTMKGEDFLLLYAVWLLVLWAGVLLLRFGGKDHPVTTLTGWALFEGMGGLRYLIGSAHGMQRWEFLVLMMIFGSLFFIVRAHHFENM